MGKELNYLEKITVVYLAGWGGSTKFLALSIYVSVCQIANCNMPKRLMCITDMHWDQADYPGQNSVAKVHNRQLKSLPNMGARFQTVIESVRNYLQSEGKIMPEFIVWNAGGNSRSGGTAAAADTPGTFMISGFSTSMLKLFLSEGNFGDISDGSANS